MICLATKEVYFVAVGSNRFHSDSNFQSHRFIQSGSRVFCSNFSSNSNIRIKVEIVNRIQNRMAKMDGAGEIMLTSGASGRVNALLSLRVLKSLLMLVNAFVLLLIFPFRGRRRCHSAALTSAAKDDKQDDSNNNRKGGLPLPVVRVPLTIVPWKSSTSSSAAVAVDQEVAARRALAIRKVMDGCDVPGREYSLIVSPRGDTIFTRSWTPLSIKTRALVILLHGLNEHCGRYDEFAKQLNAHGYKVYGMDWVGHGGSDGLHAYVHSLDDAVTDVKAFIGKVLAENTGLPCFCFGHSTGAAIILKAVLDPNIEKSISGVVLTSPAVGVQPSHPIFTILAPVFSYLLPKYQLSAANKKGMPVSRDPEALMAKYSDPLVYTGSIRIRTGYEILRITSYLQNNMQRLKVPFFVLHGTADTITDPEATRKLYEEAASEDKSIKLLNGYLHDLLFEPERQEIVREIIEWLNMRM